MAAVTWGHSSPPGRACRVGTAVPVWRPDRARGEGGCTNDKSGSPQRTEVHLGSPEPHLRGGEMKV